MDILVFLAISETSTYLTGKQPIWKGRTIAKLQNLVALFTLIHEFISLTDLAWTLGPLILIGIIVESVHLENVFTLACYLSFAVFWNGRDAEVKMLLLLGFAFD